jgi:hypothetical protein
MARPALIAGSLKIRTEEEKRGRDLSRSCPAVTATAVTAHVGGARQCDSRRSEDVSEG